MYGITEAMIRYYLFAYIVLICRVLRMFLRYVTIGFRPRWVSMLSPEITGDTNVLATPNQTIHALLTHPSLGDWHTFVDIGCGEGLAGAYVRFRMHASVQLCDHQAVLIWMLRGLFFLQSSVMLSSKILPVPNHAVVYLAWTSWSDQNREDALRQVMENMPKRAWIITVSIPANHPRLRFLQTAEFQFAWGRSPVYYYTYVASINHS